MDNFSNVEKIGEGTYGVVYKGKDILTGKQIALKKIKLDFEPDGVPSTALREISVLRSLHHSAVVELFDVMVSDKKIYLIFEYLPMDLKCFMELTKKPLCPDLAKSYLRQLLEGLAYCHGRRVIHRDIKPQNLLVDAKGNIKLADFGLCRTFGIPMRAYTHEVITLWYRAPEILLGSNFYSTAVDVWSVACVYAEMVNGRSLFPGDSEIDQLFRVFRALGTPGAAVWHEASELPDFRAEFPYWEPRPAHDLLPDKVRASPLACALFDEMLRYEPCARLAAHRASRHPYLADAHRLPPKELREYACTSSSSSSSSDSQYSS